MSIYLFTIRCFRKYRSQGELTLEELQDAEIHTIKSNQHNSFKGKYDALTSKKALSNTSKLMCLKPVLNRYGIIRAKTRLQHAEYLHYNTRKTWVTKIVKWYHVKGNHVAGTNNTLLSARFWLLQGREEIREWETV